jgi:NADPH-dependent glutamate synthase beta subunit-like oxidoreductase
MADAHPTHVVAVIGGAVAGAEAASTLAAEGIAVAVFEQNARPYGKIEDGLPRWHGKLRSREYARIDEQLTHDLIEFVPLTRLGRHVDFNELVTDWGFQMVLLANGAWRDRPLGVEGIEAYEGKGFYYQNPFIYWFNHHAEATYGGPQFPAVSGAMVVGGGLASIDVAKALMIETVADALAAKQGVTVDPLAIEHAGVPKVLEEHGETLESLGVEPCTLYYRRTADQMPLASDKPDASAEQRAKTEQVRVKILGNAIQKYLFKFVPLSRPVAMIVEDGRVVGLTFQRTRLEGGRVLDVPGETFEARAPLTISSIGSIPDPIGGVPMQGQFYVWRDWDAGELEHPGLVWGVGNVVTGKGNIVASRRHSKEVAAAVIARIQALEPMDMAAVEAVHIKIKQRQAEVGYGGDYAAWMKQVTPVDMQ